MLQYNRYLNPYSADTVTPIKLKLPLKFSYVDANKPNILF